MDLFGEFQKGEIDGRPFLVYQNVMKPLPQIQTPNTSDDEEATIGKPLSIQNNTTSGDISLQVPLFICPTSRTENITIREEDGDLIPDLFIKLETSPLLSGDSGSYDHVVLPLFWCNNKEADPNQMDCGICKAHKVSTDYYYCVDCDKRYHKQCVESPLEISYPSHVKHSLQLYLSHKFSDRCILCTNKADLFLYYCALCDIYMHPLCAQEAIPFFIDQPKRHDHTLSLFPRQASLTCNICGLVNKLHLTYACPSICDFVSHSDCIQIPQTIRISRHYHRVSFTSTLSLGRWSCGVCRRTIDPEYGAYTCNLCNDYAVHTKCALRTDIWDGIELEGVLDEDEDIEPFERISDEVILHFSHGCHLKFETSGVYDRNKFCQACALPINEDYFYVCVELCDFILHDRCAYAPRRKVHPLHPHPLIQKAVHEDHVFKCDACMRTSNGFGYRCTSQDCDYILDVVCASTSEPFEYQGHEHPLFMEKDPRKKPICHICKSKKDKVFNCIECEFVICFKCATLPYKVRYEDDDHYLIFCGGYEASDKDWCEICENRIGKNKGFYKCYDCCTSLHINCLLGPEPYLKPGQITTEDKGDGVLVIRNNFSSRPICYSCSNRCPYPTFYSFEESVFCSLNCFHY